mmetsp:Transcript_32852/g.94292  ORF Transcript_32852/g.94292 Transcript_32852/m.94292 type:complete len:225 (+) Transcript_32852:625-1299(+)
MLGRQRDGVHPPVFRVEPEEACEGEGIEGEAADRRATGCLGGGRAEGERRQGGGGQVAEARVGVSPAGRRLCPERRCQPPGRGPGAPRESRGKAGRRLRDPSGPRVAGQAGEAQDQGFRAQASAAEAEGGRGRRGAAAGDSPQGPCRRGDEGRGREAEGGWAMALSFRPDGQGSDILHLLRRCVLRRREPRGACMFRGPAGAAAIAPCALEAPHVWRRSGDTSW